MKTHFLIWQAAAQSTVEQFFTSMYSDAEQLWCIFCQNTLLTPYINESRNVKHISWPQDPTCDEQWTSCLNEGLNWVSENVTLGQGIGEIALDVLIDETLPDNMHDILLSLQKATLRNANQQFVMHLVWLCDAVSDNAESEKGFLEALKKDPQTELQVKQEAEREESDGLQRLAIQQQEELKALPHNTDDSVKSEIYSKYAIRRKELLEACQKKKTEVKWFLWNRLTILASSTSIGAALPIIREYRDDIIYTLIASSDFMPTANEAFQCVGYEVHVCPYTRNDVSKLPDYLLWQYIREHSENGAAIRKSIMPDFSEWEQQLTNEIENDYHDLEMALLADDNNYDSRSGIELFKCFKEYNRLPGITDDKKAIALVNSWVVQVKKELAKWIDIDDDIRKFLDKDGEFTIFFNEKLKELENQDKSNMLGNGTLFGKSENLKKRKKTANVLGEEIKDCMVHGSMLQACRIVKERLPELLHFIANMDAANRNCFEEVDKANIHTALLNAMSNTLWYTDAQKARASFRLENLQPDENDVEHYENWLKKTLDEQYFRMISGINKKSAMDDYPQLAYQDAVNDHDHFAMICAGFYSTTETVVQPCVGTSTRLYVLGKRDWRIMNCIPEQIFIACQKKNEKQSIDNNRNRDFHYESSIENPLAVQPEININQDTVRMSWRWPSETAKMSWCVLQRNFCCMSGDEYNYSHTPKVSVEKKITAFPDGELILRISNEEKSCEKSFTVPHPRKSLRLEQGGLFNREEYSVNGITKLIEGIPNSSFQLAVRMGRMVYHYPLIVNMKLIIDNSFAASVRAEAILKNEIQENFSNV